MPESSEKPKKPTKPLQVVRAAGVLLYCNVNINDLGKFFLLMRHSNRWDLPKGHCDGDESFLETAIREMEEETGISREKVTWDPDFQFDLRYRVTYRRHGDQVFDKHVRYFLGKVPKKMKISVTEHDSFEWLPWDPPHQIQAETIDPLLAAVAMHWNK